MPSSSFAFQVINHTYNVNTSLSGHQKREAGITGKNIEELRDGSNTEGAAASLVWTKSISPLHHHYLESMYYGIILF